MEIKVALLRASSFCLPGPSRAVGFPALLPPARKWGPPLLLPCSSIHSSAQQADRRDATARAARRTVPPRACAVINCQQPPLGADRAFRVGRYGGSEQALGNEPAVLLLRDRAPMGALVYGQLGGHVRRHVHQLLQTLCPAVSGKANFPSRVSPDRHCSLPHVCASQILRLTRSIQTLGANPTCGPTVLGSPSVACSRRDQLSREWDLRLTG